MTKKAYEICLMRGDGIGPEILDATLLVMNRVSKCFNVSFDYREVPAGDGALRKFGVALPKESVEVFASSDACLKSPVGETVSEINTKLRFAFDLYANLRPAKSFPSICPPALRPDIDLVVVRENSEGFYRAIENQIQPGIWTSTGVFTEQAANRIAEFSFRYLMKRKTNLDRSLVLATKANIFRNTHGMYLRVFEEVAKKYPAIRFSHLYADALCARLVKEPHRFNVIVAENLIADLLSDLTGQIAGGLGMTAGTNINYETKRAYFEPTHGSAPDIVGKGMANPIGMMRSAALMLEYLDFAYGDEKLSKASEAIGASIATLLSSNKRSSLPVELGGAADARAVAESLVSIIA
jgi:3-isopropylmalate dehydrogenase